jgi:RNA polymerase sigma-70 factor (ECF subfamily)
MSPSPLDLPDLARQHRRLRRLVVALVGDEHGAEDVVQDAWLRALEHGPREPRALGAWLGTVTRRLASNLRRGQRRRSEREQDAARAEALPSSQEIAARLELEARVLALVDELEEPHRTVLRDRYLGELTPMELARRDGVPLDTVKARLTRARAALRAKLERAGLGRDVHWTAALAPLLVPRDAWHLVPAAEAALGAAPTAAALPIAALVGPAPVAVGLGVSTLASVLIMKKLIVAVVVLALGVFAWRSIEAPATEPLESSAQPHLGAAANAALAPVAELGAASSPPTLEPLPIATRASSHRGDAASAGAWVIRGRARVARPSGPYVGLPLELALYDGYEPKGEPWHRATVVSGADGTFSLPLDDPLRTVVLTVSAEGDAERAVVTYGPYVSVAGEAPPGPVDVLVFPRDARLVGRVHDERGNPVLGCKVAGMYGAAETDTKGRYEMRVAASAWGGVTATAPGFGEELRELEGLVPGGETTVDFVLRAGGVIEGTVRDEQGAPLEGVRVATFGPSRSSVLTDRVGRYVVDWIRLVEGEYVHVTAEADGFVSAGHVFELPADTTRFEHEFVLQRGVTVSGRVVDPDGAPVRGAEVWQGSDQHSWDRSLMLSDDDGRFVFAHVAPGSTQVGAEKPGLASARVTVDVPAGQGVQGLEVALARARTVRGIVQDERGAPLEGVSVAAHRDHDYVGAHGRTDARGVFEVRDLPDGPLNIEAFAKGLVRAQAPISADQQEVVVTMRRAGRLVGRVLEAATEAPLGTFTVRFVRPSDPSATPEMSGYSSSWVRPGKTFDSADGTWSTAEHDELEPGAWTGVEVSAPGFAPRLIGMVAVRGHDDDTVLVHELVRPVRVELTVVDARRGQPVVDAALLAATTERFGEEDPRWSARTDLAGLGVLSDVAPGPLFVRVTRPGRAPLVRGPFDVPEGGRRAVIVVELPGGGLVDVTLMDEAGAPLTGRTVNLTPQAVPSVTESQRASVVTDAEGRARFEDVLPGRWQVARVMRDGEHESQDLWRTLDVPVDLADVRCELRAPGTTVLRGTVESTIALPEGLVVSVVARDASTSFAAFVRDGTFEVRGLAPGKYMVSTLFWERGTGRTALGHSELVVMPNEREVEVALSVAPRS